jgi:hypothetical protein
MIDSRRGGAVENFMCNGNIILAADSVAGYDMMSII